jgi:hypothetical protein
MADIAEIGIKIETTEATRQVNALGSSLDKLAAHERRVTDAQRQLALAHQYTTQAAFADRFATDAHARAMGLAEVQAYKLAAAQQAGANAGVGAAASISRVREAVTSMTASMLQSAPGVAQLTSVLGAQALGGPIIVGVLAGIAAMVGAWKAWHEEANKAKAEQDKLTDSLVKWYDKQKEGAAGEFPKQIEAMTQKIKDLRKELDGLASSSLFTRAASVAGTVGAGGSKAGAWFRVLSSTLGFGEGDALAQLFKEVRTGTANITKEITTDGKAIAAATTQSAEDIEKAAKEARGKALAAEIALFSAGLAGPDAPAKMQAQINEYSRMAAQFAAAGDIPHALEYADAAKQLTAALKPLRDATEALWQAKLKSASNAANEEARAAQRITEETEKQTKAITDNVVAMQKQLAERFKQQSATAKQQSGPDKDVIAQQKYVDDMRALWQDGAGRIAADFIKSMSRGFEEVYSLAVKLMRRMEEEFKRLKLEPGGLKYDAIKYGAAAIGGGLAGYSIGQQTGSTAGGVFGGAASGALTGAAFGPWGAAVGGLAGAAGGLLGASSAQKDAAEQLRIAALALQAQAGAFIAASHSGNSVVDSLGSNDATVAALLKAGGFQPSEGRTARPKYTGADIEEAGARNAQRIADDFWSSITAQMNALRGPAGVYENRLADIKRQYDANIVAATALHATQAQLAEIEALRATQEADLIKSREQAQKRQQEDFYLRGLAASDAAEYERVRREAEKRREIEDLIAEGANDATIAMAKWAQGLEDVALAAQKAAKQLNDALNHLNQQFSVFGTNPMDAFKTVSDLFGFGGMSKDDVLKQYTRYTTDENLTPQQLALNDKIATWLKYFDAAQQARDAESASTNGRTSATQALTAVSAVVTDRTALMLVDLTRTSVNFLSKIEQNTRSGSTSGGNGGIVIHQHNTFSHKVERADMVEIVDDLADMVNQKLSSTYNRQGRFAGSVR